MSEKNNKGVEPMDPGAREGARPEGVTRRVRRAYALDTLVKEVERTFGEVVVTYGDPDNWQVIHEATFEVTDPRLGDVLNQAAADERIEEVAVEDHYVWVKFWPSRRIRDNRDSFSLSILLGPDQP